MPGIASGRRAVRLTIMPEVSGAIEAGEPSPPRRRSRGPSVVGASLVTAGWLIVVVLGLVALLRLVAWDSVEPLIVLDALTPIVFLPTWVVTAGALLTRRWWLAAAAAVIVAAQLVFAWPEVSAAAPVPAWAGHAPVVRVFDANIDQSLDFQAGYVRAIEQDRPDLVTLEEFTASALQSMLASGVLANFPYRCVAPTPGATGFLIASRLRLTGCRVRTVLWDGNVDAVHGRGHPLVPGRAGCPAPRAYSGAAARVLAGVVRGAGRCRPVRTRQRRPATC